MRSPSRAFWEFYLGAAVTFTVLVIMTAINPLVGGIAWIVAALIGLLFWYRERN